MVTGSRQRRRPGPPVPVALALMGICGALAAAQSRINAELGHRIGSAVVAAFVSFSVGTVVVAALQLSRARSRAGLRALLSRRGPWWQYLGGAAGAFFVFVAAMTVPVLGVAVLSVAQVFGQTAGALVADRLGLSPSGRQPLSWPRIGGSLLGVIAVVVAALGRPAGHLEPLALSLAIIAGFGLSFQVAINGVISARVGDPLTATVLNFVVGTVMLGAVVSILATGLTPAGGVALRPFPADWWLYTGGLFGIVFVTAAVLAVPVIGVLRVGLGTVAGQLVGAMLLDTLVPGGPGVSVPVVVGGALTIAAVALAGLRPTRGDS